MNRRLNTLIALSISLSLIGVGDLKGGVTMKLMSPEFENNKPIPDKFTCEGEKVRIISPDTGEVGVTPPEETV